MKALHILALIGLAASLGAAPLTAPYPGAPACASHSTTEWHGVWDAAAGCHYDHEHGDNPFTQAVAETFPGYDLRALLCGEVGVCTPSSQAENSTKHGGWKFTVALNVPCVVFESSQWCVSDAVIEWHAFGNNAIELETRYHSAAILAKLRDPNNLSRSATIFIQMLQDYGQIVAPYQGPTVLPYPDTPMPAYAAALGPYWSVDPYGGCTGCRISPLDVFTRNLNNNETVTSKGGKTGAQTLFNLLFRVADAYQLVRYSSITDGHPFDYQFVCGGASYNPDGCRYNNSSGRVHEVAGIVPAGWDNAAGWDTEPQVGRVSVDGYVTGSGQPIGFCQPGLQCYRVKFTRAFIGKWGGNLCPNGAKCSNTTSISNPDRDVYFNGEPSGWLGANN